MNILIIIDEYGWAWDFHARAIQKYSKHNIHIKRTGELNKSDVHYDVYHYFGLYAYLGNTICTPSEKTICGIRSHARLEVPPEVNVLTCNSKPLYELMKKKYPSKQIHLIRSAVDVDIFKPIKRPSNRFVVGWAGKPHGIVKRFHLLKKVNFPLIIQSFKRHLLIKGRTRQDMVNFYGGIDAYICVSESEGMPTVVLEAGATGLPIVSTPVGDVPKFLDKEWLLPLSPDELIIEELNKKLAMLKNDRDLRRRVGQNNLEKILKNWTCDKRGQEYDRLYESMAGLERYES